MCVFNLIIINKSLSFFSYGFQWETGGAVEISPRGAGTAKTGTGSMSLTKLPNFIFLLLIPSKLQKAKNSENAIYLF